MKKRIYVSGILLILAAVVIGVVLMFGKKIEVHAASTVLVNQPYQVHFSETLNEKSIDKGYIYLTNEQGNRVDAQISIENHGQTVAVINNVPGDYVLHVEKNAFTTISSSTTKQQISYEVIEQVSHIESMKDLQNFFITALNNERRYYSISKGDMTATEESAEVSNSSADTSAGGDYSTTNNQVEGIEEGDIVVTDGKYIYSILDNQVIVTDASNPKKLKQVSKITLDKYSYPMQLMIHDDMLVIIKDQYVETNKSSKKPYISGFSMTTAAFYNIEDPTSPTLIREIGQDGYMNGVRKYNDVLYIVTNKTPDYWILNDTPVEDVELRPYTYDSAEEEKLVPMEFEQLSILPGSTEPNYTIISAVDLNNFENEKVETKGYLGGSSSLYMSPNALYLTATKYEMPTTLELEVENNADESVSSSIARDMIIAPTAVSTDVYKFAINGTSIDFAASTSINGTVLNQFSMDEYNGHFRVAVTEGYAWGNDAASKNHLYLFNDKLEKVGEVTDLARGERIYSVRFMGDKAYIVTFKEVDPLFVIDLENPSEPKVLGELKIPGFSNYLHPLDENHLIGIGYETETVIDNYSKQPFTVTGGIKVSLFDITDFANPKEQDTVVLGGRGTYSDVQYNHKALFRNAEYSYFGFPVSIYEEKGQYDISYEGSGAVIYKITAEDGIELKGDLVTPAANGEQYENWETMIQRIVYIEDTIYTVSSNTIKSYDLETFKALGNVKLK
nr:beta-propeller domain-containing protein [Lysinibacillus timonensis]